MRIMPVEDRISDYRSVATSGGSWSANTDSNIIGYLLGVRIRPASTGTIFDIKIVDRDSFVLVHERGLKGEAVVETTRIPVRSILTVSILNASADEAFTLKLMIEGV